MASELVAAGGAIHCSDLIGASFLRLKVRSRVLSLVTPATERAHELASNGSIVSEDGRMGRQTDGRSVGRLNGRTDEEGLTK